MSITGIFVWFYWLLTNPYFWIFYMAPSYALVYLGLKSLNPLIQKNDEDRKRDEKYHAFKRHDLDKISHLHCYLSAPFVFIRWIVGWF